MHHLLPKFVSAIAGGFFMLAASSAVALVNVYSGDNGNLALGGLLQLQFKDQHPVGGNTTQNFIVRRLQLEFEASFQKNWLTRLQLEFGQNSNHPSVFDAYIRYTGFEAGNLTFGNQYAPFSRERLTSAKTLELPERTFIGDINFGVPGRQPGIVFAGSDGPFDYSLGWSHAGIQPSTSNINFASPVNSNGQYTGNLYAGRLQYTPWGQSVPYSQGDLGVNPGVTFGANAYRWSNDASIQSSTPGDDWNSVNGYGVDAAYRGGGFSLDAGYNWFDGTSRDPTVTSGIIQNGEGRLRDWTVKGGYMLMTKRLELVASLQNLNSDAWSVSWKRSLAGVNYFFDGNNLKVQFALEHDTDEKGVAGSDENIIYLQLQQAF